MLVWFCGGWGWGWKEDACVGHLLLDLVGACGCYGGGCTEGIDGLDEQIVHRGAIDDTDGRVGKEGERRRG